MVKLSFFDLPTDTPLFTIRARLVGREYILRFDYNGREDRWYLTILDIEGTPLRRGLKAIPGVNLLAQCYHRQELPQEPAMLYFYEPGARPVGLVELGRTCSLVLLEELAA